MDLERTGLYDQRYDYTCDCEKPSTHSRLTTQAQRPSSREAVQRDCCSNCAREATIATATLPSTRGVVQRDCCSISGSLQRMVRRRASRHTISTLLMQ